MAARYPVDPNLQNSYGPEMAPSHEPQTVAGSGLEALPGQPHATPAQNVLAPPYHEQAAKDFNSSSYYAAATADPTRRPRKQKILGLSVVAFWAVLCGLIIVLAVGLGAGLGVGLSSRSQQSTGSSGSATTTSDGGAASTSSMPTTATPTSTSMTTSSSGSSGTSAATTTTTSSTTSSTSAAATAASVMVCGNAYLDSCTTISVPASSCVDLSSSYNDTVSSLATGSAECSFWTGSSCTGSYWTTNGTQELIPAAFNDAFSSVSCE